VEVMSISVVVTALVSLRSNVVLAPVLLRINVMLVTMEKKSTSRCIATDIWPISLKWEVPTLKNRSAL
jgi:hypothetical protein